MIYLRYLLIITESNLSHFSILPCPFLSCPSFSSFFMAHQAVQLTRSQTFQLIIKLEINQRAYYDGVILWLPYGSSNGDTDQELTWLQFCRDRAHCYWKWQLLTFIPGSAAASLSRFHGFLLTLVFSKWKCANWKKKGGGHKDCSNYGLLNSWCYFSKFVVLL